VPAHSGHKEDIGLLLASGRGSIAKMRYFMAEGANIRARGLSNETPLHCAAAQNSIEAIKLLVNHDRGSLNAWDFSGYRPIHYAAWYGHTEAAVLLVSFGALINVLDEKKKTPLDIAVSMGHGEVATKLTQLGGISGGFYS